MTFGQKLQKLRKDNNWSQEELANKITVSRQAISKWELDEVTPDTENIIQLSEIFNVSTDFLLKNSQDSEEAISITMPAEIKTSKEINLKRMLRKSYILLLVGVLIVGTLVTLSQIITSQTKVETYTPPGGIVIMKPDGTTELSTQDQTSYKYMEVKSLLPFLNTYYLHWLFILGCILIIASFVTFIRYGRLKKRTVV